MIMSLNIKIRNNFKHTLYLLKYIFELIIYSIIIYSKNNYQFYNNRSFYKVDRKRYSYLKKKYYNYIQELPIYNHTFIHMNNIFWTWLQGEENAPQLYKACLNSLKRNIKNHKIILINNENINKFVKFPSYILKKYKDNKITKTHFSDLLRLELLIKYSGTWIDSSVLLTKYEEVFFNNNLFFFQSFNNKNVAGSNWFLTSEKNSPILKSTRDLLYEYYRTHDILYNYFIFHFFFKFSCERYFADFQKIPKYSNEPVHILQSKLLKKFSIKEFKQILNMASVHKLTNLNVIKDEKKLYYHYIIDFYLNNNF